MTLFSLAAILELSTKENLVLFRFASLTFNQFIKRLRKVVENALHLYMHLNFTDNQSVTAV